MLTLTEDFKRDYAKFLSEEFDKCIDEADTQLEEAFIETQKSFDLIESYFDAYKAYEESHPLTEAYVFKMEPDNANGTLMFKPDLTSPYRKFTKQDALDASEKDYEYYRDFAFKYAIPNSEIFPHSDASVTKKFDDKYGKATKEVEKADKKAEDFTKKVERNTSATNNLLQSIYDVIKDQSKKVADPMQDSSVEYSPETMFFQVQKLSQMKFPQNIIFFIKQLISWCKNLVIAFISKITNAIRRLFGLETKDTSVDLKLKLSKAKRLEAAQGLRAIKNNNKYVSVYALNADEVKDLSKEAIFEGFEILKEDEAVSPSGPVTYMMKIDISDDLNDLKQLVNHFFNIFDSSYGSNGEFLFKTDDLQLLLRVFDQSMREIADGNIPQYEIQGRATELVAVDKEKLRINLEKTLVNTEKLKKVYTELVNRINNILKIITHKQLLAATDMGVSFRFYSAATYKVMDDLVKMIDPRIKEAEKMEKDLEKMKTTYENLTIRLGEMNQAFMGLAGVTYQTIAQRTVRNLFDSARTMTQTITLRLTTLSLYLKALKDVRAAISTANAVNVSSKNAFKGVFN